MLNNDPDLHVDNIFRALGSVGRYQLTQVSVGCLIVFVSSGQLLNNVFIAREVPHHCAVPSNGSSFWERYSSLNGSDVTYEKCEVLITRGNETVGREPCPDGVEYEVPEDISVASQFNLVCDQKYLGKLSQTMVIIGQGVGAFFLTIVSDRFGRKLALVGSNFAMLVCGLAVTFSQNYPMFAVSKFFIGVCQQGIHASNHTFMLEMFPLKARRVKSLFSGITHYCIAQIVI